MENNIKIIQDKLIANLERLDNEKNNVQEEVARSNAISQLANTYVKTCNLIIRVEESKNIVKNKIEEINK